VSAAVEGWIRGLLLLFLLLLVAESLLPSSYQRYARFTFGLLIFLAVLRPWASFLRAGWELPAPLSGGTGGAGSLEWSEKLFQRAAEEMVREELRALGAAGVGEVSVEMREGKPWKVKASVKAGEGFSREEARESLSRLLGISREEVYLY
jgi:hypothetical protein